MPQILCVFWQEVVNNLCLSKLVVKDEDDEDVKKYIHEKLITPILIKGSDVMMDIICQLNSLLYMPYNWLSRQQLVPARI